MAKRKLKPLATRRKVKKATFGGILKDVEKRTGFRSVDIKIVVKTFFEVVAERLLSKKAVHISGVGLLYPLIRPARCGVNMNGYGLSNIKWNEGKQKPRPKPEKIMLPDMWALRFYPTKSISKSLQKVEVTEEELENIYLKED